MEDDEQEDRKPRRSTQKQSQSQRRRRDPSPDADDDVDDSGDAGDGDSGMTLDAKASALVRLAFATEYKRGALRREEVVKKGQYTDNYVLHWLFD